MAVHGLDDVESAARADLDGKFAAREIALSSSRTLIRTSANAIRALHRGEVERAEELMELGSELLDQARQAARDHPSVLHAGFVSDAAKEYAEARLTAALSQRKKLPLPAEIGVETAPYLNGLGEAVGELRRRLLDLLRQGEIDQAEDTLDAMVEVLDLLASLDYPDGMTGGLRRTTDVARALIERSRADLTTTVVQERLRVELQRHVDS
ncbi:MAG: haloacid dehalogenase [Acidimicrobiia bacterium]|nr:haloacid dehalogenase [Acidimicrobiia bacterium]